jgi:putative endopeptidase
MSLRSSIVSLTSILLIATAAARAEQPAATAVKPIVAVDRAYMDPAVSPCKDFYTYANGAFDKVPIPGEYPAYGVNQEINERNFAILKEILENAARVSGSKEKQPNGVIQRVGDFYASGMDEAAVDREGLQPLKPWLERIAAIASPKELVAAIAELQAQGTNVGFHFDVQIDDKDTTSMIAGFSQGGLGLPERDYYFRAGKDSEEIRTAYVAHIARPLELAGDPPAAAKSSAAAIMAFETKLAKASRTLVDLRDPEKNYNKYSRAALLKLAPDVDWNDYFAKIVFPQDEMKLLVRQPEFLTAVNGLLTSEPLSVWRDYLRWHLIVETANYLSKPFVEEHFAFFGKRLSGATELRPRWKRVMAAVDAGIGEDLGQLYVRKAFSSAAKARALVMVDLIKEAMRQRIRAAAWMSQATKDQAYKKLDTMRSKIGYPDKWRDYSKLQITRRPYALNALAANAFEFRREMAKLGKPVDRDEWQMTPQTNNAYYDPTLNEMCFPAGILQPPFFDEKADDASNYGATGATMGHELTHGFDDQGRQYDWQGNLKNWWTADDAKGFQERADCVARQYDAYEVLPGLHINGRQTLGENIADVGGLRVAYTAFNLAIKNKKLPAAIDGFTPEQRFFIAFAQSWRTNERPEEVRLHVASDVHSPVRWRVLGSVANYPEFLKAFDCKKPAKTWPEIW